MAGLSRRVTSMPMYSRREILVGKLAYLSFANDFLVLSGFRLIWNQT
ncbi:MAG: hypothetical protein WBB01_06835 [Phormidesmis sp.]